MKKNSLFLILLILGCTGSSFAQKRIWGALGNNFTIGNGSLFYTNEDKTSFTKAFNPASKSSLGDDPYGIIHASDGNIYGICRTGGAYDLGTLFKITADGVVKLHDFIEGYDSYKKHIVEGSDGFIYGVFDLGYPKYNGYIFKIKTDGSNFQSKKISLYGFVPHGDLTLADNGSIYGMSQGASNGFIYRIKPDMTGIETIFTFSDATGKQPWGNLNQGDDGMFYGMTSAGGAHKHGTIFKINTDGTGFTKLYDFVPATGISPHGGLTFDGADHLYGMTTAGGSNNYGVIFQINKDGSDYTVLHVFEFNGTGYPENNLILDSNMLYGFARGTQYDNSVLFSINTNGTDFNILQILPQPTNGSPLLIDSPVPSVHLILPADQSTNVQTSGIFSASVATGATHYKLQLSTQQNFSADTISFSADTSTFNVYGLSNATTYYAHVSTNLLPGFGPTTSFTTENAKRLWGDLTGSAGSIYHVNLDGSNFVKAFDTNNGDPSFSERPENILRLNDGSIIGTTSYGGSEGWGDIFKIDETGLTNLHNWEQYAFGSRAFFTELNDGFVYGVGITAAQNQGRIFRFKSDGSFFESHTFGKYGFSPAGYLTPGSNGNIYGLSVGNGPGWIYKLKADLSGVDILYTFSSATGKTPQGELIQVNEYLYGTLHAGGNYNKGTLFKIGLDGSGFTKLHDFNGTLGNGPVGELIADEYNVLYGVTNYGGTNNKGVLYRINSDGSNFTVLHNFDSGATPEGHLTLYRGVIYATVIGDSYDGGYLFSIKSDGSNYQKLLDFPTGAFSYPNGRLLLIDEQFDPMQHPLARISTEKNADRGENKIVKLYPNPFADSFTIQVMPGRNSDSPVNLNLYDVHGAAINHQTTSANTPIEIGSNLPPGVYILSVQHEGKTSTHRLIKK
jgi:uncharacterized repeat protein (TIGR03803 family)